MQLLELGTNRVLIDLTDSPKLYDFAPRFLDAGSQSYRRGDKRLVTNDSQKDKAELRFEFQRLTQAEVDTLEGIYRSREPFICVPDPVDEPEKAYTVRWVSSFDRSDTVVTDWTQGRSLQAVFRTVDDPNIYTPAIRIEIEGVDVTDRLTRDAQGRWEPITIGQSLDHPKQSVFRNSLISFSLDNEDGVFDYSSPNNFFASHSKPAHGRGAQVLIRLGLSKSELIPAFAGQINEVQTSLANTKARITIGGLSQKLSQNSVKNFGEEITRKITDFDYANVDYDDLDPIFYFPAWGLPIARGSVSLTVHQGGADIPIEIVDIIATSGTLSNTRAEIDYERGLIRFELPPTAGKDTQITATWKVDYKYKRPDFLIRQLLKHSGLQSDVGITDDKAARFGIEQALISHPTDESFSSHGRPYPAENGVVRWMRRDDSGDTPVWGMIQDQRYLEYDEYQDEYRVVATLPEENVGEGVVADDYGLYLPDESFSPTRSDGVSFRPDAIDRDNNRMYVLDENHIFVYLLDGTAVPSEHVTLPEGYKTQRFGRGYNLEGLAIYNGLAYIAFRYEPLSSGSTTQKRDGVLIWNLETNTLQDSFTVYRSSSGGGGRGSIAVNASRIYVGFNRSPYFLVFDHDHNQVVAETQQLRRVIEQSNTRYGITITDSHLYVYSSTVQDDQGIDRPGVKAVTLAGVRDETKDIIFDRQRGIAGLDATNTRLYVLYESSREVNVDVYQLGVSVDFGGYVPYQFHTADDDNIFFLCANNTQGNAVSSSALRKVKVYKYDKSAGNWTDLLNERTGQPQLSHAYKLNDEVTYLAENRKNFQVIRHNNKTLIFYRRVRATESGIAYYNDTNGTVTDVYSEAHSGAQDYGLPYSMDFALDVRRDGIYVYTFVVRHTLTDRGNYNGGTLKVYRKRVEPDAAQTEIYSESFSAISGLTRRGETSTTERNFSTNEVGIYDDVFVMAATSTEAAAFTTLRAGDTITLQSSSGNVILTLSGSPTTGTRNSHPTIEVAAVNFTLSGSIVDNRSYAVYANRTYPVSVSDLILADNRSKFYFIMDRHGEGERVGKAELCTIAKDGSGSRTVIKTYENPLISARSPVERQGSYFYLEGGWVRPLKDDPTDETIPHDQHHYPNEGGHLIEINSDDTITDHGQVWRSGTKQDSPDPENEDGIYDSWGRFNAVISNIVVDYRGNLHFVVGHGTPYNVRENLPFSSNREPVPALSNFHWLMWGKDLSTKIASFPTGSVRVWALIQQLAQIMNWEIGFGPSKRKVDAIQSAHSSITDWSANTSLFFRPRSILPAKLRTAIGASGAPSILALNDSGLPAEMAEFPDPTSGERYAVIIGREMFSYSGVAPDSRGRALSGIQRAQNGSVMAAHNPDAGVYFVDYFASGELGTTLVGIQTRSQDFINLRNDINVGYGQGIKNAKSQTSIDANGQFTLDIEGSLLSRFDEAWAEVIGQAYCEQLCELKELLTFTLVFSPELEPGQLLVLYQQDRIQIDFKLFKLLSVQHHIPRWQTGVTALEIR